MPDAGLDIEKAAESGLFSLFETLKVLPDAGGVREAVEELVDSGRGTPAERAVSKAIWLMTGTGVVASLPGAIPGLGTAVQAAVTSGSITGETWLLLRNLTVMQLVVAGVYGYTLHDSQDGSKIHPERKNELLIIWGLETGVIVPATEAGKRVGTKIAISQFNQKVSGEALKKINQRIGTTVLTKWGTKRGGIALGRLIPLGVGAVVGGGMNFIMTRSFGNAVIKYYRDLRPDGGVDPEVVVIS